MKSKKIIVKIKLRGQGEGMGKERLESYRAEIPGPVCNGDAPYPDGTRVACDPTEGGSQH